MLKYVKNSLYCDFFVLVRLEILFKFGTLKRATCMIMMGKFWYKIILISSTVLTS
jgi:hypothetical protein